MAADADLDRLPAVPMSLLIHKHTARIRSDDGTEYRAATFADERPDGTWAGWIEFAPADGLSGRGVLRTSQETSQPDRKAVEYWAGGLEPVYLEGALARARSVRAR